MIRNAKNFSVLPVALAILGCGEMSEFASAGGERSRVVITAQSGSEVVLTKNVGGARTSAPPWIGEPVGDSLVPGALTPDADRAEAVAEEPDAGPAAAPPLGEVRERPWRVTDGETLFQAVSRFAGRAGYTARKPEQYPVWEVTVDASYSGEFEGALGWLMAGFEQADPRPVISLHPNRIVRLAAE